MQNDDFSRNSEKVTKWPPAKYIVEVVDIPSDILGAEIIEIVREKVPEIVLSSQYKESERSNFPLDKDYAI